LPDEEQKRNEIGVATGLAWTETGGEILHVEALITPGKGSLILTGHLGEVMKESAQAALTYARSKGKAYRINPNTLNNKEIHIHVPAGAIPKDGPSAGITMAVALFSSLAGVPVRKNVAMTGEITLRGRVLPVGGLKEKALAALRNKIKDVIIPYLNKKDLADLPLYVRKKINFTPVKHMDEVLRIALSAKRREMRNRRAHSAPHLCPPAGRRSRPRAWMV
jgi:ATP-dependent Lon protease